MKIKGDNISTMNSVCGTHQFKNGFTSLNVTEDVAQKIRIIAALDNMKFMR